MSLDALSCLKDVFERCRGRPLVRVDRDRWYGWSLELLNCEYERETWGIRSPIEAWFGLCRYRTRRFWCGFPSRSATNSTESWLSAFATLHNATL